MIYFWATLLVLLNLVWLALNLLGLPGNWLIVASTVAVAVVYWDAGMFSIWTLLAIFVLGVVGELVELLAGMMGSKTGGASRRGVWGALLGGVLGAILGTFLIPIPALGSLIGACGGACLGAWGMELAGGREMGPATKSAVGAGVGRFLGTLGKILIGVVMWLIVAVAAFWP